MGSTVYWNNNPDEHLKQRKDITISRRDWKLLNGHFCPSIAQCIYMYYLYVIFLDMIKALWVVIDDDKALLLLYIYMNMFIFIDNTHKKYNIIFINVREWKMIYKYSLKNIHQWNMMIIGIMTTSKNEWITVYPYLHRLVWTSFEVSCVQRDLFG